MSFGFSIGDIIAVSSIALKIYSTIHEAQSEQTALVHELEFFGHLVELIGQRLVCTDLPRSIARSTEQQLVQCQQLLLKLDAITKKYMAGYPGKQRFRMVKWGLWKRDQVMRLLGDLRSLIGLLDFLLCTYTTETLQENNAVLKRIESSLPICLDEWAGCKPIYFIDALERRRVCSFELCDTWEGFQDFVTFSFRDSAGQKWAEAGKYVISHETGPGRIIDAGEWSTYLKPGMTVSMAMVLQQLQVTFRPNHGCPSCERPIPMGTTCQDRGRVQWSCGTWFQMSSVQLPDQVAPNHAAALLCQKMGRETIGPDLLCDLNQLRLFRRWHIMMRYCSIEYAMANEALARTQALKLELEQPHAPVLEYNEGAPSV